MLHEETNRQAKKTQEEKRKREFASITLRRQRW